MKNDDLDEYIDCIKNESVQDSLKLAAALLKMIREN